LCGADNGVAQPDLCGVTTEPVMPDEVEAAEYRWSRDGAVQYE